MYILFAYLFLHPTSVEDLNVVELLNIASSIGLLQAVRTAEKYIIKYFTFVSQTLEFELINANSFINIIKSDEIVVTSEKQVFEAAQRWLFYTPLADDRAKYVYAVSPNQINPFKDEYYINYLKIRF